MLPAQWLAEELHHRRLQRVQEVPQSIRRALAVPRVRLYFSETVLFGVHLPGEGDEQEARVFGRHLHPATVLPRLLHEPVSRFDLRFQRVFV